MSSKKEHLRKQPVAIVGAGPGDVELITMKGRRLLDEAIGKARQVVLCWIENGIDKTMNEFNESRSAGANE